MVKESLNLEPLRKALDSLERAILQPKNEFFRDSVIQRFEYTFELSWKLLKRALTKKFSLKEQSIKGIFREGATAGIISNPEPWFTLLEARNLTSHTYAEQTAEAVYEVALTLPPLARELLDALSRLSD